MSFKKLVLAISIFFLWLWVAQSPSYALDYYDYLEIGITPIPCKVLSMGTQGLPSSVGGVCTLPLNNNSKTFDGFYNTNDASWGEPFNTFKSSSGTGDAGTLPEYCATTFTKDASVTPVPGDIYAKPFTEDPRLAHFWAEDQEITALGKSNERARQFVNWVVTRSSIDQSLVLKIVWQLSRNVALSFMIIITAIFGLAIIVSRRLKSGYKFTAQNSFGKVGMALLFIMLSATMVFVLIAISEIIMKFFIEALGGNNVFNTYFGGGPSNEMNYVNFVGCRDLNIRVKESADTTIFLLKLTNVTYYAMGVMLILRKILLWFLLFVSPFLPLLLSFPLIRNTGRIWIGVFFQWLMYGPLFALFFGATAKMFENGIPFGFDFSRIEKTVGYIFPTAIIIAYGGPAQASNGLNSGNYIDTFMEYVIALVLWWAVTWFPWWLLRIYRDDCCDGIYSMRNGLFGLLDKLGPTKPSPVHPDGSSPIAPNTPKIDIVSPKRENQEQVQRLRLENPTVVRQAKTESIVSAMNLRATSLKDIAQIETNSVSNQSVRHNLQLLENPLSASSTTDRQTYLNIRTELFTRASTKNDAFAQRILNTTNRASQSYINRRNELVKSVDNIVSNINEKNIVNLTKSSSDLAKVSESVVTNNTTTIINNIANDHSALQAISNSSKVEVGAVKQILGSYNQNISKPFTSIVSTISENTQVSKEKVKEVLKETQTLIHRAQSVGRLAQNIIPDKVHAKELISKVDSLMTEVTERASAIGGQVVVRIAQLILNIIQNNPTIVGQLEKRTNTSSSEIRNALEEVSRQEILNASSIQEIVNRTNISKEKIQDIIVESTKIMQSQGPISIKDLAESSLPRVENSVRQAFESTEVNTVGSNIAVSSSMEILEKSQVDSTILSTVETKTSTSEELVKKVLESVSSHKTINTATISDIVHETGLTKEKVQEIILETSRTIQKQKQISAFDSGPLGDTPLEAIVRSTLASGTQMEATQPIVSVLSNDLRKVFSDEKVSSITKEILRHTIQDEQLVTTIQQETGLSRKQVLTTLETLSMSPNITDETVLTNLAEKTGVEKVKALQVVRVAVKQANVAKSVATPEGMVESDIEVTRMLENQLEMALNPEGHFDEAIPLDPSELDEYEEIRKLWIEQYRTGQVPVSENIQTRAQWVAQDLEVITGVLRKLVSKDEAMRQQALDEIGFILPIFLMNNLSATQLITYLKAKAGAAREVKQDLEKQALESESELQDVKRQSGPVEENTKHLEVDEETGESKTAVEGENQNETQ